MANLVLGGVVLMAAWLIIDTPSGFSEIRSGVVTEVMFVPSKHSVYKRVVVRDSTGTVWVFSVLGSSSLKLGDAVPISCSRRRLTGFDYCELVVDHW